MLLSQPILIKLIGRRATNLGNVRHERNSQAIPLSRMPRESFMQTLLLEGICGQTRYRWVCAAFRRATAYVSQPDA